MHILSQCFACVRKRVCRALSLERSTILVITFVTFVAPNSAATIQYHATGVAAPQPGPEVIRVLRPALEKLSIQVEVCRGAQSGSEILSSEKFDAVIVDCDDLQGGLDVIPGLRKGSSNRHSVTFAIVNGTTTQMAFQMGANFVLQKPISPLNAMRCFSAAIGYMDRERRRYFRHPVEMPVAIFFDDHQEVKATATNISDGGMAILFGGKLPKANVSKVSFRIPGTATALECTAQFAWIDGAGRAGLRFEEIAKNSREQLERWLSEQFEESHPAR